LLARQRRRPQIAQRPQIRRPKHKPKLHLEPTRLNLEDAADVAEDRAAETRAEIAAVAPEDVVDRAADAAAAKWFI